MQKRCVFPVRKNGEGKLYSLWSEKAAVFQLPSSSDRMLTPVAISSLSWSCHGKENGCKSLSVLWCFYPLPGNTQFNRTPLAEIPFSPCSNTPLSPHLPQQRSPARQQSPGLALRHIPSTWQRQASREEAFICRKIAVIHSVSHEWFIYIPELQISRSRNLIKVFHRSFS